MALSNHKSITSPSTALDAAPAVVSSTDITEYLQQRDHLIQQEQSLRFDHAHRSALSDKQRSADRILNSWRSQVLSELPLVGEGFYPSRIARKQHPQAQRIYNVLQKMPKGANLHCHLDGACDARYVLHLAATTKDLCISSDIPLVDQGSIFSAQIKFRVIPGAEEKVASASASSASAAIYSASYKPDEHVPVLLARNGFPYPDPYASTSSTEERLDHLPIYDASTSSKAQFNFDCWLHALITLTPHPNAPPRRTPDAAWKHFITTFGVIEGIIGYEPNFKLFCKQVMLQHARDGVRYFEARINFWIEAMVRLDGTFTLGHRDWCRIFLEAEKEVKQELAAEGVEFDGAKIIYSTIRFISAEELRGSMEDCIDLKTHFPDLIVGFDLVGHEDPGITLKQYLPELLWFRAKVDSLKLDLPFILHAGETISEGGDVDHNLYDAILLGTKRIGHGYSLSKHPLLLDMCKERGICVESCPVSNEILRYADNTAAHPLPVLLSRNVPTSLCNDDCCQFGNVGLTHDFYAVFMTLHSCSLSSLHVLASQSIQYSMLPPAQKKASLEALDAQWDAFLDAFLKEAGGDNL